MRPSLILRTVVASAALAALALGMPGLRAQGQQLPPDSAGQAELMKKVISDLIDNEVVVSVARQYKADVTDEDVAKQVDERFNDIRKNFKSETEFREAINASLGVTGNNTVPGMLDTSALMNAARMINTPIVDPTINSNGEAIPEGGGESAINLDTGVKKGRLLIIDDEERILTALKSLFRNRYHVFATTDGHKALHRGLAWGIGGLFLANTVTGVPNLLQERRDPHKSDRTLIHGVLMLVADAGFLATALTRPNSRSAEGLQIYTPKKNQHLTIAYASISVASLGYLLMLFR